jgi:hypothetical protein
MRMCYELGFKRAIEQCIGTDSYHIPDGFNTLYLADCVDETIEYWLLSEVLSTDYKMHRFMRLIPLHMMKLPSSDLKMIADNVD